MKILVGSLKTFSCYLVGKQIFQVSWQQEIVDAGTETKHGVHLSRDWGKTSLFQEKSWLAEMRCEVRHLSVARSLLREPARDGRGARHLLRHRRVWIESRAQATNTNGVDWYAAPLVYPDRDLLRPCSRKGYARGVRSLAVRADSQPETSDRVHGQSRRDGQAQCRHTRALLTVLRAAGSRRPRRGRNTEEFLDDWGMHRMGTGCWM